MISVSQKIYSFVSQIPKGKVVTYGQVAKAVGLKSARTVGFWLHKNIDPDKIPCHRVVFSDGSLSKNYAFGGEKTQHAKLESEGVGFICGKVNIKENLLYVKS